MFKCISRQLLLLSGITIMSAANSHAVSWSTQTENTVTAAYIGTYYANFVGGGGINDSGQVVKSKSSNYSPQLHTIVYDTATNSMTDLGRFGNGSVGSGINNAGQVTGVYFDVASHRDHAYVWSSERGMIDLGTLSGERDSKGLGINNSGQVTGYSFKAGGGTHAFVWSSDSGMIDLGTLGGRSSNGEGINDVGQVTGRSDTATSSHAFVWDSKSGMIDLGTLGGEYSYGYGINNAGQVTGYSCFNSSMTTHAFVWSSDSGMIDLGTLGEESILSSVGVDINNAKQVVGRSGVSSLDYLHAFVWEDGEMYDLNSYVTLEPGEYLENSYAINNFSQILVDSNLGKTYVLTPSGTTSPVPVPGAAWLLSSGLIWLAAVGRKKKTAIA